jgi:hypothetical protein
VVAVGARGDRDWDVVCVEMPYKLLHAWEEGDSGPEAVLCNIALVARGVLTSLL